MNARNNLSYTTVKSPSDGVAGILPYRKGALVSPNVPQPLTTVSDNSEMYVYFSIDENQLLGLMKQYGSSEDAIKNMPDVSLLLSDGSHYDEHGRIESISGVIDRTTGSASVRAKFPNGNKLLHSGATGNVLMPAEYKNRIVIPQAATVQLQDKILVYKVVDGKAVSTLVSVLPGNNGNEYIVQDGLNAGDIIVAEGAGMVREGMEIK
jgi:membrane fusion protein (multidrug efflux system)